jgi:nicotinate-nucleotide pyrophosphorylase (carboxylating)
MLKMEVFQIKKIYMKISNIKKQAKAALKEDVGKGDVTSRLTIDSKLRAKFNLLAKEDLVLCGKEYVWQVFGCVSKKITVRFNFNDGERIKKGEIIASGEGPIRKILEGERVALNFLQYLSAVSTKTYEYVEKIKKYKTEILDTRKILPFYRDAVKYAVKIGGGVNHRRGLDDQILIKDNHIIGSGGVRRALQNCKKSKLKIEIECESLMQVKEALKERMDIIMLDNMSLNNVKKAVELISKDKRDVKIEVSGNMNLKTIELVAKLGVDYISVGALTHSVGAVDISLDLI